MISPDLPPRPLLILTVVPDPDESRALCNAISNLGDCEIHNVENLTEARRVMSQEPVAIVIADHFDGKWVDLLATAKKRYPEPKVIVCLSFFQLGRGEGDRAIEVGASDFLGRPFRADEVRQALGFARQTLARQTALPRIPAPARLGHSPRLPAAHREPGRITIANPQPIRIRAAGNG